MGKNCSLMGEPNRFDGQKNQIDYQKIVCCSFKWIDISAHNYRKEQLTNRRTGSVVSKSFIKRDSRILRKPNHSVICCFLNTIGNSPAKDWTYFNILSDNRCLVHWMSIEDRISIINNQIIIRLPEN